MIESNSLDQGKFLLAGDSKIPDWVLERINSFKTDLYNIAKSSKSDDKATLDQIIRSFDHYILPTGITVTKRIDKKELGSIIDRMADLLDDGEFVWYNWLLLNAGFFLSSVLPTSIDEDSLTIPESIKIKRKVINKKYEETKDKYQYNKDIQALSKEALAWLTSQENAVADFVNSGANGSLVHIQELMVGIGFAINAKGEIHDTITNCLVEGVSPTDYFSNSSQGIVALFAKSSETSKPGYLGKKLSNVCEKVKLTFNDCGSTKRLKINTDEEDYLESFIGLNYSLTKAGSTKEFTKSAIKESINKDLYFRAPPYCKAPHIFICSSCYSNELIRTHNMKENENIGLYASTGMTNSLVNLTLKKSHTGLSIDLKEVDLTKELISK